MYLTKIHIGASRGRDSRFHKYSLLFGTPLRINIVQGRQYAMFPNGSLLIYERWHATSYNKFRWDIYVLRTVKPGDEASTIPGITPGAEIICRTGTVYYSGKFARFLKSLDKEKPLDMGRVEYVSKQINLGLKYS